MNATIEIGSRVNVFPYKNKYVVEISHMHGDADIYTEHVVLYEESEIEKLKLDLLVLHLLESEDFPNEREEQEDEIVKCLIASKQFGFEVYEESEKYIGRLMTGDMTTEYQDLARVDGYEVFWYDSEGAKFYVNVNYEN